MSYLAVLDQIAKAIGGNQPDVANLPRFFSGLRVGDHSGLSDQGLKGCWSLPPDEPVDPPVGIVLPGRFSNPLGVQGWEENTDYITLYLLVARGDSIMSYTDLVPFRDAAPAAFRNKLTLSGNVNVEASITEGRPLVITWGGADYVGWEMTVTAVSIINNPNYAT